MAKQIKVIKCPQCGSVDHRQIKEDYYKCQNCGTEYFLDNDDININVTHRVDGKPVAVNNKAVIFSVVLIALVFLLAVIIPSLIKRPSKGIFSESAYGSVMLDIPVDIKGKMYLLTISNGSDGSFYSFTDFDTRKIVKSDKLLDVNKLGISIEDRNIRKFSNGDIYVVIDKQKIFKLDNDNMELKDVTVNMFEADSLYKSGIANIDPFAGSNDGDCFKVMTNMGKEYYFFPRIKQSFTQNELSINASGSKSLRSDSKEAVTYIFTKKQWESMEMDKTHECQLLKIIYQDNAGGPSNTYFRPQWQTEKEGFKLDWWGSSKERIVSYTNLTPDRLYFNPEIFYADKDYLLVKVTTTASKESAFSLQRINTATGELMWTIPLEVKNGRYIYYFKRALHTGNRFALKLNDGVNYFLVDDNGENATYFNLKEDR